MTRYPQPQDLGFCPLPDLWPNSTISLPRSRPCCCFPTSTRISSENLRCTARSLKSYDAPFASIMVMMSFLPPVSALLSSFARVPRGASFALPLLVISICSGCISSRGRIGPVDDPPVVADAPPPLVHDVPMAASEAKSEGDSEVPVAVAESEQHEAPPKPGDLPEVIVKGRTRDLIIRDLVAEGQAQLRDVQLQYVLTGKEGHEVLRGRPVAFALWSEAQKNWTIAHLEIPRPPVKWKPGRGELPFTVRTPGIEARHVKGTGAERLMFTFSRDGEELKVYGRKFPVFDNALIKKKRWREAAATARPIVYLPYTADTLDPRFITA